MSISAMAVADLFHLLESNKLGEVEEMKKVFHDHLLYTKDSWLVNGLFDYYLCTNSLRAIEVLAGVREPHDKHLLDRLTEALSRPSGSRDPKVQALTLLGHIARRQPTWLYKLASHPLFKDLLKLLKVESDPLSLMSALLLLVMLLPILPAALGPCLQEIFEVFGRLATYHHSQSLVLSSSALSTLSDAVPATIDIDYLYLLHLQVGLYSLFHRLYALYPCNFVSYLKHQYTQRDHLATFIHTVRPMLDSVRMHPSLVTSSKETEVSATRWKKMEHHDIIAECGRFTLDRCQEETLNMYNSRFTPPLEDANTYPPAPASINVGVISMEVNNGEGETFWSPSMMVPSHSPPLPVLSHETRSTPSTPSNNRSGTSPPEAAIEATPESTPVKDARKLLAKQVPAGSTVVRSLSTFGNSGTTATSRPSTPTSQYQSFAALANNNPGVGSTDALGSTQGTVSQKMNKLIAERQTALRDMSSSSSSSSSSKVPTDGPEGKTFPAISAVPDLPQSGRSESWQEDQEVLEIVSTPGSGKHGAPKYVEPHIELHDSKKMYGTLVNLSQTVCQYRFYSQCQHTIRRTELQRTKSCPHMSAVCKVEDSAEDSGGKSAANEKTFEDSGTQTCNVLPYEHLLLDILDQKHMPSKQQASLNSSCRSPVTMLDRYIEACTRMTSLSSDGNRIKFHGTAKQNPRKKGTEEDTEDETADDDGANGDCTNRLVQLMQMQLQFERQQREVHAERNRRLLGKLRDSRALEKHNKALAHRIRLMEQEVEGLRAESERGRKDARQAKEQYTEDLHHWQSRWVDENQKNRLLRERVESLESELKYEQQKVNEREKQIRAAEADLFEAAHQLKAALKAANRSKELERVLDTLQRRFLLLGEVQSKLVQSAAGFVPAAKQETVQLQKSYMEELNGLKRQLESRVSLLEALRVRLGESECKEARKEAQLVELQRLLQELKERHGSELEAVESKYKAQVEINLLLEGRLLELHGTLEAATCGTAGNVASNLASSASPKERSPPLSASLASSSEGSLAFMHSATGIIMNDGCDTTGEIPNLQAIIEPAQSHHHHSVSPAHSTQSRRFPKHE